MPISRRPEKLVVDANPIVATLLSGSARRIFFEAGIVEFAVPGTVLEEVRGYLPALAEKLGASPALLEFELDLLPLRVYAPRAYAPAIPEARRRIAWRDPDDVDVLALALWLGVPLWSNDRDFADTGIERFTTAQLLRVLFGSSPR